MNSKVCAKCGNPNSAEMSFCSNCGQPLSAPTAKPNTPEDPPPTVFMGQAPPKPGNSPFGQSGASNPPNNPFSTPPPPTPNSPFGQQPPPPPQAQNNPFGQNQQNAAFTPNAPNVQNPAFAPTPVGPPQPPKKSNKGLIFGAVGCLGLLFLGVIGVVALVALSSADIFNTAKNNNTAYPSPSPYASNSTTAKTSPSPFGSDNTSTDGTTPGSDSSEMLLSILESRKQVGKYNQTDAKTVTVADYFPKGNGAAQATYANGNKYVFLTVGKFDTNDDAKDNFEDQMSGVKANGGKVTYRNTAADGTISAIYERGGFYFAEYCNTNNYCNRIHSNNRDALRAFFQEYAK